MGGLHVVFDEMSEQRALQPPLRIRLGMSGDGTEVGDDSPSQGQRGILAVELRTHQVEVHYQPLLVFHNLGCDSHPFQILGLPISLVVYDKRHLCWHTLFHHVIGQWVIAEDVSLQEISQVKVGRGVHHDVYRCYLSCHQDAGIGVGVGKGASDGIGHWR